MTEKECYFIKNKKCEKNGECIHRLNYYYENDSSNCEYWEEKEE